MNNRTRHRQLVICDGPRCSQKPGFVELVNLAARSAPAKAVQVAAYSCLGRCASGPNVLVRQVDGPGAMAPGYRDLDEAVYHYGVDIRKLAAIIDGDVDIEPGEPL